MEPKFSDLAFPDDLYYLIEHQVWARFDSDTMATVGITSLGIALAGEIYMCRPKAQGTVVEQGKSVAVVELAKSIVSVKSALSGIVLQTNPILSGAPETVHTDPYGAGWIARLGVEPAKSGRDALIHGERVIAAMADHARLYRIE
jgi:glycine cleavage system H protein